MDHDRIRHHPCQFDRMCTHQFGVGLCPADLHVNVIAFNPTQAGEPLSESSKQGLPHRIAFGKSTQHADPTHPVCRLDSALECTCHHAAEERYEFASSHCQRHPHSGQ